MEGKLDKRSATRRRFRVEQWKPRYVVLDGMAFAYWHSVDDYEQDSVLARTMFIHSRTTMCSSTLRTVIGPSH